MTKCCLQNSQWLKVLSVSPVFYSSFCLYIAVMLCDVQVAESLLNPFGEDDDDFEINGLIDENLRVICMSFSLKH